MEIVFHGLFNPRIWTVSSDIIDTAPYTGAQCDNWDPMFVSCCEPDLAKWKVGSGDNMSCAVEIYTFKV